MVVNEESLNRIKTIHQMSEEFNARQSYSHQKRLLELMESHVEEIKELVEAKNDHFLVETGDLLILCLEMLFEHGQSIDEMMLLCFKRYEKKLSGLLRESEGL
ncbi:MAG: hypothetical protein KAR05_09090 [Candidatus Omnitrophica bacterium]|nr:hypothetical protein [Candidatus Omnitrophota bacterium]